MINKLVLNTNPLLTNNMPALPSVRPITPLSPRTTVATYERDWPLIWVLTTVFGIVFLEFVLAITWICIHNLRSKARWRHLRERGVVIVSGAALVWVDDLPLRRQISYFNLREKIEKEKHGELEAQS
jgi:hypothetical protein